MPATKAAKHKAQQREAQAPEGAKTPEQGIRNQSITRLAAGFNGALDTGLGCEKESRNCRIGPRPATCADYRETRASSSSSVRSCRHARLAQIVQQFRGDRELWI